MAKSASPQYIKITTKSITHWITDTPNKNRKIVNQLKSQCKKQAVPNKAKQMKKYMRDKFEFYGIMTQARRELSKDVIKQPNADYRELMELISLLWQEDEREMQQIAIDIASKNRTVFSKDLRTASQSLEFTKTLLATKSWWDTVDILASHVVGHLVQSYPSDLRPVMDEWVNCDNMWLRRTAIIHQLSYKANTDSQILFRYCLHCHHEKEFFIRKAIGWALREYAKQNKKEVKTFVTNNKDKLSILSQREALKHIA